MVKPLWSTAGYYMVSPLEVSSLLLSQYNLVVTRTTRVMLSLGHLPKFNLYYRTNVVELRMVELLFPQG